MDRGKIGPRQVVGVDGWRGGWVAVVLEDGQVSDVRPAVTLGQLTDDYPGAAAVGVDMPLGLVERGWREADQLGAVRLGAHRSRLFMVPPRAVWEATTHADAVLACRRRALLARVGIVLPGNLADAGNMPPDDILDAGAVAWSAARRASSLPHPPQAGAGGAAIAIWF